MRHPLAQIARFHRAGRRLDRPWPFIASRKADTVNKQLVLELFTRKDFQSQ